LAVEVLVLTRQPLRADTPRHVPFSPCAVAAPQGCRLRQHGVSVRA
jgi:hypothetical protein